MQYAKYVFAFVVVVALVYFGLVGLGAYTPESFALLSASLLAVVFERFPWLKREWDKITDPDTKQLIMALFMLVLVGGGFLLSCLNVIVAFACDGAGVGQALVVFFLAIGLNQGAHRIARKRR